MGADAEQTMRLAYPLSWERGGPRLRFCDIAPHPKQVAFLVSNAFELFFGGSGGGGKLLRVDTPIATPSGFRPIGDLYPGDYIFGPDGEIHTVVGESEVVTVPAWELTFDTGERIVAHDDHLWKTFTRAERAAAVRRTPEARAKRSAARPSRAQGRKSETFTASLTARNQTILRPPTLPPPDGAIRTTMEIVTSLKTAKGEANHAIPVTEPLILPQRDLPLDPYVLGVWLGDGTSKSGRVTSMDQEIISAVVDAGYALRRATAKPDNLASTYSFDGLTSVLRRLGVLRSRDGTGGKFVPHDYLWGSADQRLALLQGLMDTGGNVAGNSVEFVNTNQALTEAVAHLARSLGMKVVVREGRARFEGRDYGPVWRVKFAANQVVFRLTRKIAQQKLGTRATNRFHYIVAAERVDAVPMKCIQTSAVGGMYLAGRHLIPTHNSAALLAAALQYADVPGYSALILRRKLTDLTMRNALIDMSHQWLDKYRSQGVVYNANERKWTFQTGGQPAVIQFGYLDHPQDVGRYRGPLHPDTEVLTDSGWKRIGEVQVGEKAASVDPVTRQAAMQPVTHTWTYHFDGDLIAARQRNGVSFAATPDHTMWYGTLKKRDLRRDRIENLLNLERIYVPRNGNWNDGTDPDVMVFPCPNRRGPSIPDMAFTPQDWAEFLGWWITEGYVYKDAGHEDAAAIGITQKIPANQERIEALLTRCGAKWRRSDDRHYVFYNPQLATYLRTHCGGDIGSAGKRIPREVFDYSPAFRQKLLDTLVDGDGSRYDDGKLLFVTTSPQLWNDVAELAVRCGRLPTSATIPRTKFYGRTKVLETVHGEVTYRLSIGGYPKTDTQLLRKQVTKMPYTGPVHCLTVPPWHSLIIRYEGRVSITGNSEVQAIFWDELGEFPSEEPYTFLFSRLRRPVGLGRDEVIKRFGQTADGVCLFDIPLRVRAASNPGGPGCVPYGDVLTPTGWVPIQDVQPGDPVFTVTADGTMTTAPVSHVHEYDWDGDLIEANARGFHAMVTPNHRMAKVGGTRPGLWTRSGEPPAKFTLVPFEDLPGQATILRSVTWGGTPLGDVHPSDPPAPPLRPTRGPRNYAPESLPGETYCRLLGWYLSEGSTVDRDKAFDISQTKEEGRAEIRRLLEDECGFTVSWSASAARVHSARWWWHLRQFGHCHQKFIPADVKNATVPELRALLLAMMTGDGSWSGPLGPAGCGTYYTSSPQLAADFAEIALKCGYIISTRTRDRTGPQRIQGRDVTAHHLSYEINIKPATKSGGTELLTGNHVYNVDTATKRRSNITQVPYQGKVYCLTVPGTETFILRQKGSVWVSGNSKWVKSRFIDPGLQAGVFIPSSYRDNPAIPDDEYERALSMLSEIERRRMGDGDWTVQEIPGALWKLADIARDEWTVDELMPVLGGGDQMVPRPWDLLLDSVARFDRTGMGVDPTVGEGAGDECGIIIGGQEADGRVVILDDRSMAAHPDEWSATAVLGYHEYQCSFMVMEDDQGGQLNRTQIYSAADKLGLPRPKVTLRKARHVGPREQRAAAARQAYTAHPPNRPMVVHHPDLAGGGLEGQQASWVPGGSKASSGVKSPDRIDALGWLVREFLYAHVYNDAASDTRKSRLSSF